MQNYLLIASGGLGVFAGFAHSYLSEKILLGPLYAEGASTILKRPSARGIIRAVFHIPSAAWAILGAALIYASLIGAKPPLLIYAASCVFLVSGLANFAGLRRIHLGAIVLISAAALALAGLYA